MALNRGLITGLLRGAENATGRRADSRLAATAAQEAEAQQKQEMALRLRLALAPQGVDAGPGLDLDSLIGLTASTARDQQTTSSDQALEEMILELRMGASKQGLDINPDADLNEIMNSLSMEVKEQAAVARDQAAVKAQSDSAVAAQKSRKVEADIANTRSLIRDRNQPDPVDPLLAERLRKLKLENDALARGDTKTVRPLAAAFKAIQDGGLMARESKLHEIASTVKVKKGGKLAAILPGSTFTEGKTLNGRNLPEKEAELFAGQPAEMVNQWRLLLDEAQSLGMDKAQGDLAQRGFSPEGGVGSNLLDGEQEAIPEQLQPFIDSSNDPSAAIAWIQENLDNGATIQEILAVIQGQQ